MGESRPFGENRNPDSGFRMGSDSRLLAIGSFSGYHGRVEVAEELDFSLRRDRPGFRTRVAGMRAWRTWVVLHPAVTGRGFLAQRCRKRSYFAQYVGFVR